MTKSYDINKVMKRLYYDAMRGNPQSAKALIELQSAKTKEEKEAIGWFNDGHDDERYRQTIKNMLWRANKMIEKYPILKDEFYNADGTLIADPLNNEIIGEGVLIKSNVILDRLLILEKFYDIDEYINSYCPYVCINHTEHKYGIGDWERVDDNLIAKLQTIYKFELKEIPKPTYRRSGDPPGTKPY